MRRLLYRSTALAERLIGRRQVVRLSRFVLNQARRDGRNDMSVNGEILVQTCVLERVETSATIVDVGANIGEWAMSIVRDARTPINLHLFEPSSACVVRLRESVRPSGLVAVRVNQAAVSSVEGPAVLFQPHEFAGSSSLHEPSVEGTPAPLEEATTTVTLDRYCDMNQIDSIDLLKIDAEGHDFHVLLGARRLFEERRISIAQFEYNHRWISARRYLKDVFDLTVPLGYSVGKVTPDGIEWYARWVPELETLIEANYVTALREAVKWFPAVQWWGDVAERWATR